jgi:hypothetical protein
MVDKTEILTKIKELRAKRNPMVVEFKAKRDESKAIMKEIKVLRAQLKECKADKKE